MPVHLCSLVVVNCVIVRRGNRWSFCGGGGGDSDGSGFDDDVEAGGAGGTALYCAELSGLHLS